MGEPAASMGQERRGAPRRRIELLIRCRRQEDDTEGVYFTRNLSQGGLMFESPELFAPETPVEVGWYAPVPSSGPRIRRYLSLRARVAWVAPIPEGQESIGANRYQVGVSFQRPSADDHDAITLSCRAGPMAG